MKTHSIIIREALCTLGRTSDHRPGLLGRALVAIGNLEEENTRLRNACIAALSVLLRTENCGDVVEMVKAAVGTQEEHTT